MTSIEQKGKKLCKINLNRILIIYQLTILMVSGFIYGCSIPTYENYVKQATGIPIQVLIEAYSRNGIVLSSTTKLDNGNDIYIVPIGSKCKVHWEVNSDKITVGVYKTEGDCNF